MSRPTKKVARALTKKGFREQSGGDHHFYYLYVNGRKTIIATKISRGSHKDISDRILKQMQNQLRLPYKEFNEYLNCTFSERDYKEFLSQQGIIEKEYVSN